MLAFVRPALGIAVVAALVASAGPAAAAGAPDVHSANMSHIGHSKFSGTTNSDMAFWGHYLIAGTYAGPRILDISRPANPREISRVRCNGGQGDVSVWRNLIFESVDSDQTKPTCDSSNEPLVGQPPGFEGIRIFDWSDPAHPRFVTAVHTDCGSHTHTIVPDPAHGLVYLYVQSYPLTGQDGGCNVHTYDSVVKVPLADPKRASVSHFDTGPSQGCHDVQVFMPLHVAAAACLTEGQIWDIRDPAHPAVIQHQPRHHHLALRRVQLGRQGGGVRRREPDLRGMPGRRHARRGDLVLLDAGHDGVAAGGVVRAPPRGLERPRHRVHRP